MEESRDSMGEEEADGLAVVGTAAGLSEGGADVDSLNTVALLLLLGVGDGVGNHQAVEAAAVQVLDRLAGQDTVDDDGVDFLGAVLHDRVGGLDERAAGVGHVVDDDGNLVLDVADEDHARDLVGAGTFLVDQSELQVEAIGDGSRTKGRLLELGYNGRIRPIDLPLGTTGVGGDNDAVADVEVFADPLQYTGLSIQVVDGDIEETLDLGGV